MEPQVSFCFANNVLEIFFYSTVMVNGLHVPTQFSFFNSCIFYLLAVDYRASCLD
ncbi:hypothetical protein MA16_Dca027542 [Dendrobium catenatum]|uniref:Uncharacterized protein n=1 Tax=Dendrobium catenatum TaxID=906689 RepID=A0A2I0WCW0_9ASPA|nr:hypothetical protein MA16_Dca027542 [Dendrobium catenatum]